MVRRRGLEPRPERWQRPILPTELTPYGVGSGSRSRRLLVGSQLLYPMSYSHMEVHLGTAPSSLLYKSNASLFMLIDHVSHIVYPVGQDKNDPMTSATRRKD